MLLNLSNHPSVNWPEKQFKRAIELYNEIQDLPFPQIPPDLDSSDLDLLVNEYVHKIRQIDSSIVHIMGEMTFTYKLVQQLKGIGIACIASTTERKSIEKDGIKTSIFEFVQFRNY